MKKGSNEDDLMKKRFSMYAVRLPKIAPKEKKPVKTTKLQKPVLQPIVSVIKETKLKPLKHRELAPIKKCGNVKSLETIHPSNANLPIVPERPVLEERKPLSLISKQKQLNRSNSKEVQNPIKNSKNVKTVGKVKPLDLRAPIVPKRVTSNERKAPLSKTKRRELKNVNSKQMQTSTKSLKTVKSLDTVVKSLDTVNPLDASAPIVPKRVTPVDSKASLPISKPKELNHVNCKEVKNPTKNKKSLENIISSTVRAPIISKRLMPEENKSTILMTKQKELKHLHNSTRDLKNGKSIHLPIVKGPKGNMNKQEMQKENKSRKKPASLIKKGKQLEALTNKKQRTDVKTVYDNNSKSVQSKKFQVKPKKKKMSKLLKEKLLRESKEYRQLMIKRRSEPVSTYQKLHPFDENDPWRLGLDPMAVWKWHMECMTKRALSQNKKTPFR